MKEPKVDYDEYIDKCAQLKQRDAKIQEQGGIIKRLHEVIEA